MPRGKTSWYGGPRDSGDNNRPASGVPNTVPGIALYNRRTLGGYYRVVFPNGRSLVLKQTDIGPSPGTGRKVDVNYTAVKRAGYTEKNFPTDKVVEYHYLGKNRPRTSVSTPGRTPRTPAPKAASGSPFWRNVHLKASKGQATKVPQGYNYGDTGPAGQALWTGDYRQKFLARGGGNMQKAVQAFRQLEARRAGAKLGPTPPAKSNQTKVPPQNVPPARRPVPVTARRGAPQRPAPVNPKAPAITGGTLAPGTLPRPIDRVARRKLRY